MAAPITHIVLAEKVFDEYFPNKDKREFFIGTSFPDIRRLGKIDTKKVHFDNLTLEEVKTNDSFSAGMKFHSIVDVLRRKYVEENNMFDLFPESNYIKEAIKIFEDKVLYGKFHRWSEVAGYFNHIYKEELTFGVKKEDVRTWHKILAEYFLSDINNDIGITNFILGNGTPRDVVEEMVRVSEKVKDYKKCEGLVLNFYNNFEELIEIS